MERKLSHKASQMRQLFTRNQRGRAATMNSPTPTPSTSSSRSRSATTPVSSHPELLSDTDPTRYYHFTDEPGYFTPAELLIDRQLIAEDLEDDMKHACSLLVESIERGLPIWPAQQDSLVQASHETPMIQDMTQLSLSPVAIDNNVPNPECDFRFSDTTKSAKTYHNSFSAISASGGSRFYGRRLSSPPPEEEEFERGRPRGRSILTYTTSPRSRSRSRSSSPGFFPYSPPQFETHWERDTTQIVESSDFPESDAFLGAEGINWLRASLDLHNWNTTAQPTRNFLTSAPNTAVDSGPAPRRFYSTRQKPAAKAKWDGLDAHESRESGIYRGLSMNNLSIDPEKHASDFSYPVWTESGHSPDAVGNTLTFYDIMPDAPARHRRKRASELLKKLTGLGTRRKESGMAESRKAVPEMA
ncbi:hypothetical protein N7520_009007 [Penicillium odoratum]|uniref:uncharacterized protein n=1 Tax=Penicillium odoratum TaxID=1167516 RepID=UPI0025483015|nr:uncharacterized protein N7520_009007 [Penicillium odoratum]KAJ5752090.1 hypothetical protein N7520_009007 [Penicillium odoratum]